MVLLLWITGVVYVLCLSCFCVSSLLPCGHPPAGKESDLLALVCDVELCFCHLPMWLPWSGVVLDCIDSRSLPTFFLSLISTHVVR